MKKIMCGIGGCTGIHADLELIRKMSDLIRHRGPDDHGSYIDKGIGIFSNRLSIIDLEGGHQPIFNEDESLVIVFNGEIYNFPELKQILLEKGHRFRTRADTEVILHGFEEYGSKIFAMLNGMFTVALWDLKLKRLILARDRVGIKPLYYTRTGDGDLVFCSEVKGILAHPRISAIVDQGALCDLISLYYVPFEKTLFSGIYKLQPGCYFDSVSGKTAPYWIPPPTRPGFVPEIREVREALEQSVKRQLISDVEVGSFLSGGLDTSTIVAFATKYYPHKLKTFCMGFGHEDDELEDAKKVAEHFGTEHYDFTISDRAAIDLYPRMIWHSEQPKLNTYSWFVDQYARKYVKVCLSGLGGDELFFGYPTSSRYVAFQRAQKLMKVPGASALSAFTGGKKKKVLQNLDDRTTTYLTTISPVYGSLDNQVFKKSQAENREVLHSRMEKEFFSTSDSFVQQAVRAEFQTKLVDDFLSIDDAMCMAHSLENRVPLLDNQLIDLMLPVEYKYDYERGIGKALLRKAMKGILPENTFRKPKQGFSLNIVKWWPGELGEEIRRTISDSKIVRQYFEVSFLENLAKTASGSYSMVSLLWHIYAFHVWHEIFVEGDRKKRGEPMPQIAG
jgi:asparagine synthase (glutamine-hydrolysing)